MIHPLELSSIDLDALKPAAFVATASSMPVEQQEWRDFSRTPSADAENRAVVVTLCSRDG
jgi:hypothetical protein